MVRIDRKMTILACAGVLLAVSGCGTEGLTVGPVRLEVPLGTGTVSPTDLLRAKSTVVQIDEDLCTLPTEADITALLQQTGSVDLSAFVTITQLLLAGTELQALSGDFSFITAITVGYIPKPVDGVPQDVVVIGTANAPGGFGSTITLQPAQGVDLLALILENDANPAPGCPKVRFEATIDISSGLPSSSVSWVANADVDAYAAISLAKLNSY